MRSMIDFAVIQEKTQVKVQEIRVQRRALCGNDHFLLRTKIIFLSGEVR